jgi:hypothetical protein
MKSLIFCDSSFGSQSQESGEFRQGNDGKKMAPPQNMWVNRPGRRRRLVRFASERVELLARIASTDKTAPTAPDKFFRNEKNFFSGP